MVDSFYDRSYLAALMHKIVAVGARLGLGWLILSLLQTVVLKAIVLDKTFNV